MTAEATLQTATTALPSSLQRLVLTGFMGAGKSCTGRLLAAELGWNFLDLDTHLERRAGTTIAELFELHGEARFRRLESCALANALARERTVIALGGGTPELLTNRLLLEQTPGTVTIFLRASFEALYDRCMLQAIASPDHIRPVLASPVEAEARFHLREPLYRRVSRMVIDTTGTSPEQTSRRIVEEVLRNAAFRIQPR